MKQSILVAAAALVALSAPAASRVVETSFPSKVLGVEKPFVVYLPDGYDADSETRYPVLYLLHGAYGDARDWSTTGTMQEITDLAVNAREAVPMIIVMPDARGDNPDKSGPHLGYFSVPCWDYETYFFDELIPHVDSLYRTIPDRDHRAIAGLSMGGGGSVVYGQRHPDVWSAVCSMSGSVSFEGRDMTQLSDQAFGRAAVETDPVRFVTNATPRQVEQMKTIRWYADCGDDDFLAEANTRFFVAMRKQGIPMEYRMRDGAHNWTYWRTALPEVLSFVSTTFRDNR